MGREQTILEMEFELAMSTLSRVWDEIERTEMVEDARPVLLAINGAAKAWKNLQFERKALASLPYVIPEIGR